MASNAFTVHLIPLLRDAYHLSDAADRLPEEILGREDVIAALNRAVIVINNVGNQKSRGITANINCCQSHMG